MKRYSKPSSRVFSLESKQFLSTSPLPLGGGTATDGGWTSRERPGHWESNIWDHDTYDNKIK